MVRAAGRRLNPDQHRRVPDFARDLARFGCNLTRSVYFTLGGDDETPVTRMNLLSPSFNGQTQIASSGAVFLDRMRARVQSGLLMGKPHWRSRYAVTKHTQQELAFRASDIMTAINVGLNEVILRTTGNRNVVEYSVSYRRWAAYVVCLGAFLGIAFALAFLFWDIEAQVDRYAFVADPPLLNRAIGLALFWGLILFWALVWPWILIVMHRPFARKLLDRIIREVDIAAQQPVAPEP